MKYLLTLLLVVMMSTAFGEQQYNITFELPNNAKKWSQQQISADGQDMIVYFPLFNSHGEGLVITSMPIVFDMNLPDADLKAASLEALREFFPDCTYDVSILEKNNHSTLLQWSAKNNEGKYFYAWVRYILVDQETTMIIYFADETNLEVAKSTWIPVLQAAH